MGSFTDTIRSDAQRVPGPPRRYIVPTTGATRWVATWAEFKAAGGVAHFDEDQTELCLTLPEPFKFSIRFERPE